MTQRLVTVVGGTGFLGRTVVRRLVADGCRVRVVARHPRAVDAADGAGQVQLYSADIGDEEAMAVALAGADAVVNAVSLYVESRHQRFDAVHVEGAARVARLAARAGLSGLVHVSGIGADTASASAYVRARGRGEQVVQAAFPQAVILRPSVMFGPNDAFLSALEAVTRLPVVPLFGSGQRQLQPVHVDDVAAATVAALSTPSAAGRVFELGGAGQYTYRQIVRLVLDSAGRRRPQMPVPFWVWKGLAIMASSLPQPPLTRDQVILMQADNVVGDDVATFADLGITPCALESALRRDGVR